MSKLSRRAKRKKRGAGVNDTQVAETPSEFSFAIARTAVAQICKSIGFKTSQNIALETLTNVCTRYLETIVRSAATFANASNRTDSNIFDLINGIHDLCSLQGFSGGSMMHKSNLLRSSALKDIMNFVNLSNQVSFAKPIPLRNVSEVATDSSTPRYVFKEAKAHIPGWLPYFPKENCDHVLVKERKCGEKLWEHSLAGDESSASLQSCDINGKEEKDAKTELPKGREMVKFKIRGEKRKHIGFGVNLMNMVCKGRKRLYWNHHKIDDCVVEKNEDEKDGMIVMEIK